MNRLQVTSAYLLALPLLGSGINLLFGLVDPVTGTDYAGERMWNELRGSGLMPYLALGHFVIGMLLLLPRWRFVAGLLQLPVTLGIVAFNLILFPPGIPLALAMLVLNFALLADRHALVRMLPEQETETAAAVAANAPRTLVP